MTFKTGANPGLGIPAFSATAVDTVAKVPVGTITKGYDDTLGDGTFIYLPGAASIAAGDVVAYDLLPAGQTVTRTTAAGQPNSGQPLAVALVPVLAGQYGWFQIAGVAAVNVTAGAAVGKGFLSATAGSLTSTQANGVQVLGARISSAIGTPAAAQSYLTLNHPHVQGQIV